MAPTKSLIKILSLVVIMAATFSTAAAAQHGSGEPGVASFLSAVNSVSEEIRALNAEKNVTANDVHLMSVAKLTNPGNAATLSKAIAKNSAQIAALREAIKANAAISAKLAAGGVSVDQVVAMDVNAGTEIHIFYQ
jgi:aminoglycoside/choline kinase family phosphotransferase